MRRRPRLLVRPSLPDFAVRALVAAGLAIDAYCHASVAPSYDANKGSALISEGNLFRIEAAVASLAALIILVIGRKLGYLFSLVVSASAVSAILLFRYTTIGALGPLPNMDEPTWMAPYKVEAFWAEAVTLVLLIVALGVWSARRFKPAGR